MTRVTLTILLMSCSIWVSAKHHWPEWVQLANTHYQNNQYDSAYTYYFKAGHFENTPDSIKTICFKQLAVLLYQQEQYEKSIENFNQAAEYFNNIGDHENEYKCWSNMANVYLKLEQYELAENLHRRCLTQAIESKDQEAQFAVHINLSALYYHSDKQSQAVKQITKAQNIAEALEDTVKMKIALHNMSTLFLNQNIPDSAFIYLRKSLASSKNLAFKKAAIKNLHELYLQLDNTDSAVFYLNQYHVLADSLKNGKIAITIARLEKELEQEKDRAKFARAMNWIIALCILLIVGLTWWYIEKRRTQKRINELQTLSNMFVKQLEVLENEKSEMGSKLHSNISPSLFAARSFIYGGNIEKGMNLLDEASKDLSYIQNHQLYSKRFNQTNWLKFVPTNAKNSYQWIEITSEIDPKTYTTEYKIAVVSILEQLLQDGQQSLRVYPDDYGVEVNSSTRINYSENTKALLNFFDCKTTGTKIHIPLLKHG